MSFSYTELAKNFKNKKININLNDKVLGLISDKSSTRTRVSFQVAMSRLADQLLTSIQQHHKLEEESLLKIPLEFLVDIATLLQLEHLIIRI